MEDRGFAKQLRKNGKLLGAWCTFASFSSVEVMTRLGFDFLVLDLQHSELSLTQFPRILGAFADLRPVPIVRVPEVNYHTIGWLLDQGTRAILAPMVNSVETARRAVEAAKFPPVGKRSFGPYRASGYSFDVNDYMARASELATLIVQVENAEAARNVDKILTLPGIDAVFMGPNDLAFSMLREGQSLFSSTGSGDAKEVASQWTGFARTPEVLGVCEQVLNRCRAAGIPFGMTAASIEDARHWLEKGAQFMTFGSDFLFMRAGAKYLTSPSGSPAA